ncbi:MAG TPA: DNA double-strand break repair nuclease NurA [Blastocatellia bacterium]|nr:DNA double-strand break repair nuclease NurA [Blastocatellia bacterium]
MIYREKVKTALESLRREFQQFDSDFAASCAVYGKALARSAAIGSRDLAERLAREQCPGAIPVEEFGADRPIIASLAVNWRNHEEARAWAYNKLLGRITFAADGSQIIPTKDYSIPVAAVQVAWFENPHSPDEAYVKDAVFEVLPPSEITGGASAVTGISEQAIHRKRYSLEVKALRDFMRRAAVRGFDPEQPPLVFFDSLLVISFADTFQPEQKQYYISEIVSLLDASERTGIPLVGFVDKSYARDLTVMIQTANGLPASETINDAGLLKPLMSWGDRSSFFQCARQGILGQYPEKWRTGLGFVYLKTASDAAPARLDLPMWIYERGLLDYVIDTVRAEVIAGNGYPYALETADATAVLSAVDREVFYAAFQEFAQRERVNLRISRKAVSKAHRR